MVLRPALLSTERSHQWIKAPEIHRTAHPVSSSHVVRTLAGYLTIWLTPSLGLLFLWHRRQLWARLLSHSLLVMGLVACKGQPDWMIKWHGVISAMCFQREMMGEVVN